MERLCFYAVWGFYCIQLYTPYFKENKGMDIALTLILIVLGFLSIYLCTKDCTDRGLLWIFAFKIIFYMQFYNIGYMFKKYIKFRTAKYSKIIICSVCILINIVLLLKYGEQMNFYSTNSMGHFTVWFLPLITLLTGILFYYEISNVLGNKIGYVPFFDMIGRNTFTIMHIHLLFVNIPNFYIYRKILQGSTRYPDFDMTGFTNVAWVCYNGDARLMGFVCGVIGSIMVCWVIDKVKKANM